MSTTSVSNVNSGLTFTSVTPTTFQVIWPVIDTNLIGGQIKLIWRPENSQGVDKEAIIEAGANNNFLITGLQFNITYEVELRVDDFVLYTGRQQTRPCFSVRGLTMYETIDGFVVNWEPSTTSNRYFVDIENENEVSIFQQFTTQTELKISPDVFEEDGVYHVAVQVECDSVPGNNRPIFSFPSEITYNTRQCAKVEDFQAKGISTGVLELMWTGDNTAEFYEIYYIHQRTGSRSLYYFDQENGFSKIPGHIKHIVIEGLTAIENYEFQIQTYCVNGNISMSNSIRAVVDNVCETLIAVDIPDFGINFGVVSWIQCRENLFDGFDVDYLDTSCITGDVIPDNANWVHFGLYNRDTLNTIITGLNDSTEYIVRVSGLCGGLRTVSAMSPRFRTFPCLQVDRCTVNKTGMSSVDISWEPDHGPGVEYRVEYRVLKDLDRFLETYNADRDNILDSGLDNFLNRIANTSGWQMYDFGQPLIGVTQATLLNLATDSYIQFRVSTRCGDNKWSTPSPTLECQGDLVCNPCGPDQPTIRCEDCCPPYRLDISMLNPTLRIDPLNVGSRVDYIFQTDYELRWEHFGPAIDGYFIEVMQRGRVRYSTRVNPLPNPSNKHTFILFHSELGLEYDRLLAGQTDEIEIRLYSDCGPDCGISSTPILLDSSFWNVARNQILAPMITIVDNGGRSRVATAADLSPLQSYYLKATDYLAVNCGGWIPPQETTCCPPNQIKTTITDTGIFLDIDDDQSGGGDYIISLEWGIPEQRETLGQFRGASINNIDINVSHPFYEAVADFATSPTSGRIVILRDCNAGDVNTNSVELNISTLYQLGQNVFNPLSSVTQEEKVYTFQCLGRDLTGLIQRHQPNLLSSVPVVNFRKCTPPQRITFNITPNNTLNRSVGSYNPEADQYPFPDDSLTISWAPANPTNIDVLFYQIKFRGFLDGNGVNLNEQTITVSSNSNNFMTVLQPIINNTKDGEMGSGLISRFTQVVIHSLCDDGVESEAVVIEAETLREILILAVNSNSPVIYQVS